MAVEAGLVNHSDTFKWPRPMPDSSTHMIAPQEHYKFSYNEKGVIIPPQPMGTPFGFVLAMSPLLLPMIPHLRFPRETFFPFFIEYLPNFWVLRRAGFVADGDLAFIEISMGL